MTQGLIAIIFGIGLFVLVLIPIVGVSYRRNGGLTPIRLFGWLALLVYAMALWSYTLLPIPSDDNLKCVGYVLDPLEAFRDVFDYPVNSLNALLSNPAILQMVLNVALFIPLGFLMRSMFRRGIFAATFTGLFVSLLIETTQITGVWWIYSCAYRVFDTNDLLTNTFGALLGSLIAGAILGSRRQLEIEANHEFAEAVQGPRKLTFWRRFLGMISDALAATIIIFVVQVAIRAVYIYVLGFGYESIPQWLDLLVIAVVWVLGLVWTLALSATPGESLVLLQTKPRNKVPVFWLFLRYLFGIGGFIILYSIGGFYFFIFVLVSFIFLIADRSRRGLAARITNSDVVVRSVM